MLNHVGEEEPIELRPPRRIELLQLGVRQHAGHEVAPVRRVATLLGRPPAIAQPLLHAGDLILLSVDDPLGQPEHRRAGSVGRCPTGHDQSLGVMADHVRHESRIRLGRGVLPRGPW